MMVKVGLALIALLAAILIIKPSWAEKFARVIAGVIVALAIAVGLKLHLRKDEEEFAGLKPDPIEPHDQVGAALEIDVETADKITEANIHELDPDEYPRDHAHAIDTVNNWADEYAHELFDDLSDPSDS